MIIKTRTTGETIKEHRKKLGLSQAELGQKLSVPVTQTQIAKWEKIDRYDNSIQVDLMTIYELSKILGVNLLELYLPFEMLDYIIRNSSMTNDIVEDLKAVNTYGYLKKELCRNSYMYIEDVLIIDPNNLSEEDIERIIGIASKGEKLKRTLQVPTYY